MSLPINQIIRGDCLEVMQDWPDNCIPLTVTSPPYDDLRDYKGYHFDFEGIANQLYRITKLGGVVVWVVGDKTDNGSETGTSFKQALYFKQCFNLHDTMIYKKINPGGARGSVKGYWQGFEYMFVFVKGEIKTFNPLIDRKNKRKSGIHTSGGRRNKDGTIDKCKGLKINELGRRTNIWEYARSTFTDHPATFPLQLAIDHIKSWSNPDDIVLDPFCGSGTTCVAAKMLGRRFIGIDISSEYCEIARQRLESVDDGVPVKEKRKGQGALFPKDNQ